MAVVSLSTESHQSEMLYELIAHLLFFLLFVILFLSFVGDWSSLERSHQSEILYEAATTFNGFMLICFVYKIEYHKSKRLSFMLFC